jgi:hypothetical protein
MRAHSSGRQKRATGPVRSFHTGVSLFTGCAPRIVHRRTVYFNTPQLQGRKTRSFLLSMADNMK